MEMEQSFFALDPALTLGSPLGYFVPVMAAPRSNGLTQRLECVKQLCAGICKAFFWSAPLFLMAGGLALPVLLKHRHIKPFTEMTAKTTDILKWSALSTGILGTGVAVITVGAGLHHAIDTPIGLANNQVFKNSQYENGVLPIKYSHEDYSLVLNNNNNTNNESRSKPTNSLFLDSEGNLHKVFKLNTKGKISYGVIIGVSFYNLEKK